VKEGYAADLVLFNPATVKEASTFDDPNRPSTGVEWVFLMAASRLRMAELLARIGPFPGE